MMRSWSIPIAISAALLAEPVAGAPPQRVEIVYELLRNGTAVAVIVDRLEHDGSHYQIDEHWQGKGLMALRGEARRTSRGSIGSAGLRPREFIDRRSGRSTARATLDWDALQLTMQYKGTSETRPLPANAHDKLSFLYGFAFAPPGAQPLTLNVADGKSVSTYIYRVAGRERLSLPAGEFDTLKLVKQKDDPQDRGTEIWLAERRGFLPVRVLVTENNGTRLDQVATRFAAP
jgi:hypothetical protein